MGVGDVAYGIALQAIEGKWPADKLGPYMARFAVDYAKEQPALAAPATGKLREFISRLRDEIVEQQKAGYATAESWVIARLNAALAAADEEGGVNNLDLDSPQNPTTGIASSEHSRIDGEVTREKR